MRQSILDASHEIVSGVGIEGLTIRGIAKRLGYSPGAIYDYFASKEEIVHYLYFEGSGGLSAVLKLCSCEIPDDADVFTALEQLALSYRQHALEHAEMYRLVFGVMKQPHLDPEDVNQQDLGGLTTLLEVVQRGIAAGDLLNVSPMMIATSAWTAAHGFMSLEVTDHFKFISEVAGDAIASHDAIDDLFVNCMRAILRGWATPDGLKKLSY